RAFRQASIPPLHEPTGPFERALLAGPAEVRKETLPVDGLEDLLDPSRVAPVVSRFLVEVNLLKGGRLGLDQHIVADESAVLVRAQSELVQRIGVDQTVELRFRLAVGVPFR